MGANAMAMRIGNRGLGVRFAIAVPAALAVLFATAQASGAETLSQKLKRQTQEFSDAGQEGHAAIMNRYLDPTVVFVNENGSMSSKKDIIEGVSPPQPGVIVSIKVTEWMMRRHGDVAVASFVDDLTQDFHGQVLNFKYRSTEVWKLTGANWRMISSQTLTVPEDPPAVALAPAVLEDYVGTYQITPDIVITITRQDNKIFSALNGGAASEMKIEVRDVLFTPGRPGRKIFQRDELGHVTGYRSRLEGRDILVTKAS
jgi:ketosteroid isomerase-like protein